ncbi:MAG TPA: ribosome silencing factor [Bacteroidales bacterium]|nr:ribosome silencing factor [Bacteroidales bacterium]
MKRKKKLPETETLARAIIEGILDKKGEGLIQLDFENIRNAVCSRFIICQGRSKVQVEAIADEVREHVRNLFGLTAWHVEGYVNAEWILIDYADIVVHVFQAETRGFYDLETLWADTQITRYEQEP